MPRKLHHNLRTEYTCTVLEFVLTQPIVKYKSEWPRDMYQAGDKCACEQAKYIQKISARASSRKSCNKKLRKFKSNTRLAVLNKTAALKCTCSTLGAPDILR